VSRALAPRWLLGLGLALVLTACGAGPAPSVSKADCAKADASGVILISAAQMRFSAPCMIAPAGIAFTVRFTNRDSTPHNLAIYDSAAKATRLFSGDPFSGPGITVDYAIPALAAGEYYFDCMVHPADMRGTLFVEAATPAGS